MDIDDLFYESYMIGIRSQGEGISIKHIMDRPLRIISFNIEKVAGSKDSHHMNQAHMLYELECMAPTIFN